MKGFLFCLLCILFSAFAQVHAWDEEGHMIVAQIAYSQLNTSVLNTVNHDVKIFYDFFPDYSDPLSAAVWADHIRSYNLEFFTTWHYIDNPYNTTNIKIEPPSNINVVWTLNEMDSTYKGGTDRWGYGFIIRYLIHLVGDIHQPLHNIEYFSSEYPNGDRGGNLFHVIYNNKTTNLHHFWDSCAGLFTKNFKFPLSNSSIEYIQNVSNKLINEFPKYNISNYNYENWSNDSYNLAIKYAYGPLLDSGKTPTLSNEYINSARQICLNQIVLAGYRLGYLLNIYLS